MKTFYALFFFCFLSWHSQAIEEPTKVKSNIHAVTVFTNGAQVTRKAEANIAAGRSTLLFTGIAPGIDKNSIQVKGEGDFTVLSVSHQVNFFEAPLETKAIDALKERSDTLRVRVEDANTLLQVLNEEESLILSNKALAGQQNGLQIEQLRETAAFYRSRLKAIRLEKLQITRVIQRLQQDQKKIKKQLSELNAVEKKVTSEVLVAINAERGTKGSFVLSYIVNNAGWVPHYDFRVKDVEHPVQVFYKAKVWQNSGESWDKVELTLSTGDPSQNGQKPTIHPWRLSFFQPYAYQGTSYDAPQAPQKSYSTHVKRVYGRVMDQSGQPLIGASVYFKETGTGTTTDLDGNYNINVPQNAGTLVISYTGYNAIEQSIRQERMDVKMQEGAQLDEVVVTAYRRPLFGKISGVSKNRKSKKDAEMDTSVPIEEIEKATTVSFKIDLPYDIPTNNKPYDVHIKEHDLTAYYEYQCAPKLDEDAFLTALVTDWEDYNLLSGEANLFFEGTYLGKSYLDVQSVEDTLALSLGRDKNIVVRRTRVKELSKKKFLSGKKEDTRAWEIEVRNKKKASINIVIEDQIPVTTNKEIEINHSVGSAELEEDTGLLYWKFTLAPQETKKLSFKYVVKYPKKESVRLE